jgi:hypothetical protein
MLTRARWLVGCLLWIAPTAAFARPQVTAPLALRRNSSQPSVTPSTPDAEQEQLEEIEELEQMEEISVSRRKSAIGIRPTPGPAWCSGRLQAVRGHATPIDCG